VVQRQSTLQSPDVWVAGGTRWSGSVARPAIPAEEMWLDGVVHYFGFVAFDKQRWFAEGR
jgi:hypothetical protein